MTDCTVEQEKGEMKIGYIHRSTLSAQHTSISFFSHEPPSSTPSLVSDEPKETASGLPSHLPCHPICQLDQHQSSACRVWGENRQEKEALRTALPHVFVISP
ncbi:hypothetical protein LZ554_001540 [Drepanopeziza brunnea f. sp. 'monogermtubi']|nr:hypothetical protein LZ554_001540 [Drepanopeziza brunnea f. sp. 'monogermtubi']